MGGSPYLGKVIEKGFEEAQCFIALFTPDERSKLSGLHATGSDKPWDLDRRQARPNVLYEAGMAFGMHERRTILVSVGDVSFPSDLDGRHIIRLSNSSEVRRRLKSSLSNAECDICENDNFLDPIKAGDFDSNNLLPPDPIDSMRLKILRTLLKGQVNRHDGYGANHFAFDQLIGDSARLDFRDATTDLLRMGLCYEHYFDDYNTKERKFGISLTQHGWEYCKYHFESLGNDEFWPNDPINEEKLAWAFRPYSGGSGV